MIYTGYYVEGMELATQRRPALLYETEKGMMALSRSDWRALDGCWVNNLYLLTGVPVDQIVVTLIDGSQHLLSSHPKWEKWTAEMDSGEFYSYLNLTEWK